MEYRNSLTAERLRQVLHYDPDSGIFIWVKNRMHPPLVGTVAGCPHPKSGHITIYVDAVPYKAHRLAWLYMKGEWPTVDLDHRNRISGDNRWENIRVCTTSQNNSNKHLTKANSSGYKGVDYFKSGSKWRARIAVGNKSLCIGYFLTAIEAAKAYDVQAIKLHGEFAVLNFPK